jgi:DNA-binding MarR family transcriptional regulator
MNDLIDEKDLNHALEAMYFGFNALIANPDVRLKGLGMSRIHHRILYFIGRGPGCSVGALLGKLKVTKQYINRPLRYLIEEGYVCVMLDSDDRRIKRLSLSAKGGELEKELSGDQREHFAKVFDQAGSEARNGWYKVMALLSESDNHRSKES